ncbi:formyl transferase [Chryseobacterium sp.]|uniref:formyl transferase n=1 Tax=Chryseobacterium sp. TaxID=1871047 RepID=UPI0028A0B3E2|nr:formyl transferase [Chryseobacterium sp.]
MKNKKIVLLAGKDISTNIIFNAVDKNFGIENVIIEETENRKIYLKRRIKRLGILKVLGQILFQIFVSKPLSFFSEKRKNQIITENQLDISEIPDQKINKVKSVNAKSTIELLKKINPDLIIVNGTRIISKKVLASINCKFINTHAGITPKYRGVHGSYWALVSGDTENSGVTIHFVDEGIDTGNIIAQATIQHTKDDNFSTYPLLQLAEGLKLLTAAIKDFSNDELKLQKEKQMKSLLWYHPTIWEYLYHRITKHVK